MAGRIGELLVKRGILTEQQVEEILCAQRNTRRPFGDIAERMYNISPSDIENAWSEQFAMLAEHVDPVTEVYDDAVKTIIDSRRAWQFGVLPIRRDGHDLLVATSQDLLARAVRFVAWSIGEPVFLVIADRDKLEEAMQMQYPFPGMQLPHAKGGGAISFAG